MFLKITDNNDKYFFININHIIAIYSGLNNDTIISTITENHCINISVDKLYKIINCYKSINIIEIK